MDYQYGVKLNCFQNRIEPIGISNFYHTYEQDLELMYRLGHKSFCFSVSWSRLIPEGKGGVNVEAVVFYNRLINKALYYGIEPSIHLFHFDMPLAMQQIGGWANRKVVKAYEEYAKICFLLFGDRVKKWFTHHEPIVHVEGGYLYDSYYQNAVDFKKTVQVAYHIILSSALAVRAYKESGQDDKIGIILNLTPSYPRSQNSADLKASQLTDAIFNRSLLAASMKGEFPADLVKFLKERNFLLQMEERDKDIIKEHTINLLGIDCHRGWEIYEKRIYDILINVKEHYGNIECFISANGMGVEGEECFMQNGIIQDHSRIEFISEHLKWIHKEIEERSNVKGYHLWTFIDNWSWTNAYRNRYSLVAVELKNSFKRKVKKVVFGLEK